MAEAKGTWLEVVEPRVVVVVVGDEFVWDVGQQFKAIARMRRVC
ncbi:hypothetical protein [Nonomuraea sp. B19D2]